MDFLSFCSGFGIGLLLALMIILLRAKDSAGKK